MELEIADEEDLSTLLDADAYGKLAG
jgi:hypothetical protein